MDRYHVIPYSVEAVQVTRANLAEVADMIGGRARFQTTSRGIQVWVEHRTNAWAAYENDWVVKDQTGRFFRLDDETFRKTFAPDGALNQIPLRIPVTIEIKEQS